MYKQLIIDRIVSHPTLGLPKWLSGNPKILEWLNEETKQHWAKNIMERVFILINGSPPFCIYGNQRQFNTFNLGYRVGCIEGNKCKCVSDLRTQERKKTLQLMHGVDNVFQLESVKNKIKSTNKQLYGVEYPSQNSEILAKMIQTKTERTNEQNQNSKEKAKQTSMQHYGKTHHMKCKTQQDIVKSSNKKKYGVEFPIQNSMIMSKIKISRAITQEEINEKTRQTVIEKYGVDAISKIKLTDLAKEILFNKDNFIHFVEGKERKTVQLELGIASHTLYLYAKKYDACNLFKRPLISNFEMEVAQWLTSQNINYQQNVRSIITPQELDFYIVDKNLAIECCGLYWHSELSSARPKNYHRAKFELCKDKNIQLITIFEDEWNNKRELILNRIRHILNLSSVKVHARKCNIVDLTPLSVKDFLIKNHIQGSSNFKFAYGLQYNNEIVAVMTFGKSRYNKKYQWELLRYATNKSVVGGSSKLLKHFEKQHSPLSIVSYSDCRWFTGTMYKHLGFSELKNTTGYQYTDYKKRYDRQGYQKHKLVKQGHSANLSEWQIMQQLGYDRIWDCGQICWVKKFDK